MVSRLRWPLLVACAAALMALPASAAARTRTTATIFHGFTASGKPTVHTRSRRGSCFTGSLAINRDDAWRCTVRNGLYDPCFSSSHARGRVVCPGLALTAGVEITLTTGLPRRLGDRGRPSLRDQPWNIELTDGSHYGFASGASAIVGGQRLNYFCGAGCTLGLWGTPRRTTQPWTILAAPLSARHLHARRAIAHAWM